MVTGDPIKEEAKAKREIFVAEYLVDLDGKRAAIAAGFSEVTAAQKSWELMQEPRVKDLIKQGLEERKKQCGLEAGVVLHEMLLLALSSMKSYVKVTPDGDAYLDLTLADENDFRAIKELETETYSEPMALGGREVKKTKIKLHDKVGPLRDLAKIVGKLVDSSKVKLELPSGVELVFTDKKEQP